MNSIRKMMPVLFATLLSVSTVACGPVSKDSETAKQEPTNQQQTETNQSALAGPDCDSVCELECPATGQRYLYNSASLCPGLDENEALARCEAECTVSCVGPVYCS
ncbi:hypothetical protein BO221_21640 [Archangium sp. Cb G35]|uniref:hypothetical protein n=1 Tax=Archangium sp. Cb G35 TaxID=1920190 RepID=UPI000937BC5F|nr:hypothetical protein [Archangium sp. Cb G35]OJT22393.1 hypothetical protein BO221_21640 [Archangium sp. Cb G35]